MKKFIKPLIIVALVLVVLFVFMQQFRIKNAEIGETFTLENDVKITMNNIEFNKEIFTDKTVKLSDKTAIIVSFTLNNSSKKDFSINHNDIRVDYDGDVDYRPEKLYRKSNGNWEESDGFVVEKITNKPTEFKAYILVPDELIENTEKTLCVTMGSHSFDLRK